MPTAHGGGRKLKNDIILIASLISIIIIFTICWLAFRKDANTVTVTVNKEFYGTYSINKNQTVDIVTGSNGEQINRLVIENGVAYISFASCPDGICVNHRPISKSGESIICLPNKVVVSSKADDNVLTPDIVA